MQGVRRAIGARRTGKPFPPSPPGVGLSPNPALAAGSDETAPPAYVEQAFRRYLECGILSHGFARAFCAECGHDFLVAFSCKARGGAHRATPGARWRRPRIWSITYCRRCRCGNGFSPYPSGCAISCRTTRPCKAGSCANTVTAAAPRTAWALSLLQLMDSLLGRLLLADDGLSLPLSNGIDNIRKWAGC
jgi:hypothetical protein